MITKRSQELFNKSAALIPGGVNSPVRACKSVGAEPLFIARAKGSKIYDVDGNEFIDYVSSWGPMILGHANPEVLEAIRKTLEDGSSFGAPTELELKLAEALCRCVPSLDRVRLVNSGTEACMSAVRLARGVTGRSRIVKFDGCYHGHADSLLVAAGSGVATLGIPGSPGVPEQMASLTLSLPYNDVDSVRQAFDRYKGEIAAVIVEPVGGNMGVVPPKPGFLEALREITAKDGALLIMDEVITGFRLGTGGAQAKFNIDPDLTTLGKIIGGGLPVGAFGGKAEVMDQLAPQGGVYQAGTLSGNPLAMAAGLAAVEILEKKPEIYIRLDEMAGRLADGLLERARQAEWLCAATVWSPCPRYSLRHRMLPIIPPRRLRIPPCTPNIIAACASGGCIWPPASSKRPLCLSPTRTKTWIGRYRRRKKYSSL